MPLKATLFPERGRAGALSASWSSDPGVAEIPPVSSPLGLCRWLPPQESSVPKRGPVSLPRPPLWRQDARMHPHAYYGAQSSPEGVPHWSVPQGLPG
ncbi:hypothetical protein NDU88_001303 [Pleurodeles waltl]|uniref:Uncharacterized protein n=1 Tax=Pleurodeles waltl TaxID=8319 RepID=A0AAV7LZ78_PLEWA|nr:hypothetical protein NDU88_001303 [Pleurodeles waltl]